MNEKQMTKFEEQEEIANRDLNKAKKQLQQIEDGIRGITEIMKFEPTPDRNQESMELSKECLTWLGSVEALGFDDINGYIKNNKVRERLTIPKPQIVIGIQNPYMIAVNLKSELNTKRGFLRQDRGKLFNDKIPTLEKKAHELAFERLTLRFGFDSVRLTNINIKVAIWVPVAILVITLLATIGFEIFKPEITDFLRHLVGLSSLAK